MSIKLRSGCKPTILARANGVRSCRAPQTAEKPKELLGRSRPAVATRPQVGMFASIHYTWLKCDHKAHVMSVRRAELVSNLSFCGLAYRWNGISNDNHNHDLRCLARRYGL